MSLVIFKGKEIVGTSYKKELQEKTQNWFRVEKLLKRQKKKKNYMLNGKAMVILLKVELIKKIYSEYFPVLQNRNLQEEE